MKITIFILTLYLLINCGCDSIEPTQHIESTYKGTYLRTDFVGTDSASTNQGLITFEFTIRTYKCEGEKKYLPPFGIGIYSIDSRYIILTDTIGHYADFDWTLILKGKFNYTLNGNNIILNQNDTIHKRMHEIKLTQQN